MPGGDRRGPLGEGPMTGGRRGFCAGYDVPGYQNAGYGFGRGLGRGFGRGLGRGYGYRTGGYGRGNYGEEPQAESLVSRELKSIKDMLSGLQEKVRKLEKEE